MRFSECGEGARRAEEGAKGSGEIPGPLELAALLAAACTPALSDSMAAPAGCRGRSLIPSAPASRMVTET